MLHLLSCGGRCYIIPVFLLTSREDPFPSVVLEAMSAGVPCVAFEESGGVPDLLRDYGAGCAVPLGDAAEMVRQMRALALLTRPDDRERLALAARRHFGWDAYADRLLRLIDPGTLQVSVVVPSYNYAQYLAGRLDSVFAQTYPVAEIVVLDDASTDGSAAVVRDTAAAAGRSVRWLCSSSNSGSVFKQWRRAADLARSEWIWIAEADDQADPGFLSAVCAALANAPDAVLAFTDSRAVDAVGTALWPDHQGYYAQAGAPMLAQDGVFPAGDFLRDCLAARNLILNDQRRRLAPHRPAAGAAALQRGPGRLHHGRRLADLCGGAVAGRHRRLRRPAAQHAPAARGERHPPPAHQPPPE